MILLACISSLPRVSDVTEIVVVNLDRLQKGCFDTGERERERPCDVGHETMTPIRWAEKS